MSASLSGTRSMALSYGTVVRPTPLKFHAPAHALACRIILELWKGWDANDPKFKDIGLFNINIPMISRLSEGLPVYWTTLWRNSYGRLFKRVSADEYQYQVSEGKQSGSPALTFKFAPEFHNMINPDVGSLPEGCDAWALAEGAASVTPLIPSFAEVEVNGSSTWQESLWKL